MMNNSNDTFIYESQNETVVITGRKEKSPGVLVIPSFIDEKPVVRIADAAFENQGIDAVVLPEGLQIIGESAFKGNSIKNVDIPDSVTEIGKAAFEENGIEVIEIPKNVISVGAGAFASKINKLIIYDNYNAPGDLYDRNGKAEDCWGSNIQQICVSSTAKWSIMYGPRELGTLSPAWPKPEVHSYLVEVRSAETGGVKFCLHIPGDLKGYEIFARCWRSNDNVEKFLHFQASNTERAKANWPNSQSNGPKAFPFKISGEIFEFGFMDSLSMALPSSFATITYVTDRLKYPCNLSNEMKEFCVKYLSRNGKYALYSAINGNNSEELELYESIGLVKKSNIDELVEYSTQKGKVECTANLLEYKSQYFKTKAVPMGIIEKNTSKQKTGKAKTETWKFKEIYGKPLVQKYSGVQKEIEFPSEHNGMPITAIANSTINSKIAENLEVAIIPEGYTRIGDFAFYGCKSLKEIKLPRSLKEIGKHAFEGCDSLASIILPDNLSEIDEYAFYECSALKNIVIPRGTWMLGSECFGKCMNLTKVIYSKLHIGTTGSRNTNAFLGSPIKEVYFFNFHVDDFYGFYLQKDYFKGCKDYHIYCTDSEIDINKPKEEFVEFNDLDEEEVIESSEFKYAVKGKNSIRIIEYVGSNPQMIIPEMIDGYTVASIRIQAFKGNSRIKYAEIPGTIEWIPEEAFSRCKKLEEVCINSGVKILAHKSFSRCTQLKKITIPGSVSKIEWDFVEGVDNTLCIHGEKGTKAQEMADFLKYNFMEADNIED